MKLKQFLHLVLSTLVISLLAQATSQYPVKIAPVASHRCTGTRQDRAQKSSVGCKGLARSGSVCCKHCKSKLQGRLWHCESFLCSFPLSSQGKAIRLLSGTGKKNICFKNKIISLPLQADCFHKQLQGFLTQRKTRRSAKFMSYELQKWLYGNAA